MDAIYNGSNSFRVFNNLTAEFVTGRRVKIDCGLDGVKYASVVSSSYSAPYTTVQIDESNLTASLTEVWYAVVTAGATGSIPAHLHNQSEGSGGPIEVGSTFIGLSDTPGTYSGSEGLYLRVDSTASGIEFSFVSTSGTDDHTHAAYVPWNFGSNDIVGDGDIYCNDIYTSSGTVYIGDLKLSSGPNGQSLYINDSILQGRTTYLGSGPPAPSDPITATKFDYYIDYVTSNMYEKQDTNPTILLEDYFTGTELSGQWQPEVDSPDGSVTVNDALELNNSGDWSYAHVYAGGFSRTGLIRLTCKWQPHKDHQNGYPEINAPMIVFRNATTSRYTTYQYPSTNCFSVELGNSQNGADRTELNILQNNTTTATVAIDIDETQWHDLTLIINCDTRLFTVDLDEGAYTVSDTISQSVWDAVSSTFYLEFTSCEYSKDNTERFSDVVLKSGPTNVWLNMGEIAASTAYVDTVSGTLRSDIDTKASTFLELTDTPASFDNSKYLQSGPSYLRWVDIPTGTLWWNDAGWPADALGEPFNYYLDTISGSVFSKTVIIYSSDQCTGGTANASEWYSSYPPSKAFDNDTSYAGRWSTGNSPVYPVWIGYQFASAKQIEKIRIHPANDIKSPRDFSFKASNTGAFSGEEVTFFTEEDVPQWPASVWKEYEFNNDYAYLYYRLYITEINSGGAEVHLSEIEMFELNDANWEKIYTPTTSSGGGSSDVQSFLDLDDTPTSYLGTDGQFMISTGSGIDFSPYNISSVDTDYYSLELVETITVTSGVLNTTISGIQGDTYGDWFIDFNFKAEITSGDIRLGARLNNDNGAAAYAYDWISRNSDNINEGTNSSTGMEFGYANTTNGNSPKIAGSSHFYLDQPRKHQISNLSIAGNDAAADYRMLRYQSYWQTEDVEVNSITLYTTQMITGELKIYKRTNISLPIYEPDYIDTNIYVNELVQEWNLDNEGMDQTFTWDGDVDDVIIFEAVNTEVPTGSNVKIRFNNDTGTNYEMGTLTQDGTVAQGNTQTGLTFNYITNSSNSVGTSRTSYYLKNTGQKRAGFGEKATQRTDNTDNWWTGTAGHFWNNTVDKITSFRLWTDNTDVTGTFRLYKRVNLKLPVSSGTGGGTSDVQSFLDLTDTPSTYSGTDGRYAYSTGSGIAFGGAMGQSSVFEAYNSANLNSIDATATTVNIDTVRKNSDVSVFDFDNVGYALTVNKAGTYEITFRVSSNNQEATDVRTNSYAWLELNTGAGYAIVPGSYGHMYNRVNPEGRSSCTVNAALDLNVGDLLRVRMKRNTGSNLLNTIAGGCNILVKELLGVKGEPGTPGESAITWYHGNTPQNEMGDINDYYLRETDKAVFLKQSGWSENSPAPNTDHNLGSNNEGVAGFTLYNTPTDNADYYTFDGIDDGLRRGSARGDESALDVKVKFRCHDKNKGSNQVIWKSGGYSNGVAIGIDSSGNLGIFGAASDVGSSIAFTSTQYSDNVWYIIYASNTGDAIVLMEADTGNFINKIGTVTCTNGGNVECIGFNYDGSPMNPGVAGGTNEFFDGDVDYVEIHSAGTLDIPTTSGVGSWELQGYLATASGVGYNGLIESDYVADELVKEWNLTSSGINETFDWDGENEDIVIEHAYSKESGSTGEFLIRPNSDSGANYITNQILSNDSDTITASHSDPVGWNGMIVGGTGSTSALNFRGKFQAILKKGNSYRTGWLEIQRSDSLYNIRQTNAWKNTADAVTSIQVVMNGSSNGWVKLYKRAKMMLPVSTISGTDDHSHSAYVPWNFGAGTISGTGDIYCNDIYTSSGTVYIGDLKLSSTNSGTLLLVNNAPVEADTTGLADESYVDTASGTLQTQIDNKPDTFIDLTDTPSTFIGTSGQYMVSNGTGLEFISVVSTDLYHGTGTPGASLGKLDDYYVETNENDLYKKNLATYGSNLATGGTASADSTLSTYNAASAVDGNTSSRWTPSDSGSWHWWKYDWGAGNEKTINKLRMYSNNLGQCIIYGSNDNSDWTELHSITSGILDTTWQEFEFLDNDQAYRYIRLTVFHSIGYIELREVQFYSASSIDWQKVSDLGTTQTYVDNLVSTTSGVLQTEIDNIDTGSTTFSGLSDTPSDYGTEGDYLVSTGSGIDFTSAIPGGTTGARVRRSTTQSLTGGVYQQLSWDTVIRDDEGYWNVSNPTRLTAPEDGWYVLSAGFNTSGSSDSVRTKWYVNGTTILDFNRISGSGSNDARVHTTTVYLNAGDYVEFFAFTDATLSTQVTSSSDYSANWGAIAKIGGGTAPAPAAEGNWVLVSTIEADNETFSESIPWDGDTYPRARIESVWSECVTAIDDITLRFNNDSASNYDAGFIAQNGSASSAGYVNTTHCRYALGSAAGSRQIFATTDLYLKTGQRRFVYTQDTIYDSADTDRVASIYSNTWSNTVDNVTSINIAAANNCTGTIKIYRWRDITDIPVVKGKQSMQVEYATTSGIYINPGEIHMKDSTFGMYELNDRTEVSFTGLAADTWYYVYTNVSGSTATLDETNFTVSSGVPTIDYPNMGYYNDNEKCIGYFRTNNSNQVMEWQSSGSRYTFLGAIALLGWGTYVSGATMDVSVPFGRLPVHLKVRCDYTGGAGQSEIHLSNPDTPGTLHMGTTVNGEAPVNVYATFVCSSNKQLTLSAGFSGDASFISFNGPDYIYTGA